jgi:ribosomal protein L24
MVGEKKRSFEKQLRPMQARGIQMPKQIKDGDRCEVIAGTHKGKSGKATDLNKSKTGHLTITVVQANGERFKTLAKNVAVK